jgi:Putative beta-barrel porin-2, OmpL-like. bbp2
MKKILPLVAVAAILGTASARAQVKVSDALTVSGWATGSYQYTKWKPGTWSDSLNIDGAMLTAGATPTKGVTTTFSVLYRPSAEGGVSPGGSEVTLLDAYVSYDAGGGVTLSAGKFLSYLGYESFYFISDNMISLANQQFLAPIPGYHEGVKLDFAPDKTSAMGVALVDSLFPKLGYAATEGDGELKHNAGFEAYYTYTGVPNLTVWAGVGYQTKTMPGVDGSGVLDPMGSTITVADIWATYQIDKASSVAAEEIYKDGGMGNKGSNWLFYYQYGFTDKLSSWFCVSGENVSDGGPSYTKYSVSPTYAINGNLSVRAQYSYTKYKSFAENSSNFLGAEVLFKF